MTFGLFEVILFAECRPIACGWLQNLWSSVRTREMRRTADLERDYLHHLRSHVASLKGPECPAGLFLVHVNWSYTLGGGVLSPGNPRYPRIWVSIYIALTIICFSFNFVLLFPFQDSFLWILNIVWRRGACGELQKGGLKWIVKKSLF